MLIELYISFMAVTLLFTVLSILPVGKRPYKRGGSIVETGMHCVLFSWIAMGMLFSLSFMSADIEIYECDTIIDTIDTGTTNISDYTYLWSCTYEQNTYFSLSYMWSGLGMVMFVYAAYITLALMSGSLVEAVESIKS